MISSSLISVSNIIYAFDDSRIDLPGLHQNVQWLLLFVVAVLDGADASSAVPASLQLYFQLIRESMVRH